MDSLDKCPNEPETYNGFQDDDGCPDKGMILLDSSHIIIVPRVAFQDGSATVLPESYPLLDEVALVILQHPEFELIGIYGHTDDRGSPAANKRMSEQRAFAVRRMSLSIAMSSGCAWSSNARACTSSA